MQRTIFMTALFFKLPRATEPTEDDLIAFNKKFALVCNVKAMALPLLLRDVMWKRIDLMQEYHRFERLGDDKVADVPNVCRTLVENTPRWLRYGTSFEMARDVRRVFRWYATQRFTRQLAAA